ncbi:MAG: dihydrolipoyl dehydrogenase [Chloroflexi bacterium]|nr:dihydrolipoyl dehydrogenase [Chloroflexota bacterium]
MKKYDVVVIGTGCGTSIVEEAIGHGFTAALIDKGPLLGGTCLNLGCIPSKMLILPADRVIELRDAKKLGIVAKIEKVDFNAIMERMRKSVGDSERHIRHELTHSKEMGFYEGEGHFVEDYTIEVNGEMLKGGKIFIASGSRPTVPPLKGLDTVDYLTSEGVLRLKQRPESMLILGGGYIGMEYGHFFAAMGTRVTIVEMFDRLVMPEEPEISDLLKQELSKRMEIHLNTQAEEVKKGKGGSVAVVVKDRLTGQQRELSAEKLLVAVGRRSNADLLRVENTGVETDKRGFVKVNDYLETNRKNIYAVGDVNGLQMFTHAANRQAALAAHNAFHDDKVKMEWSVLPHAVYSYPQIASVGLTEENARKEHSILVGRAKYFDTARGEAMMEEYGFAKAVLEKDSGKILGFHIIGPEAATLIQEVINVMASGGDVDSIERGLHIHPALPELILRTLGNIEEPEKSLDSQVSAKGASEQA